jgi:hypothetical protein
MRMGVKKRADAGSRRRFATFAALLALSTLGAAGARAGPPGETDAQAHARLGREALKATKGGIARRHLLDALALDPLQTAAWSDLASLDVDDADAKSLWALDAAFATYDSQGRPPKTPFPPPLVAAEMAVAHELAGKRAALSRAIAETAGKTVTGPVLAKWMRAIAEETGNGAALLAAIARGAAERAVERCRPEATKTRAALEAVLAEAKTTGDVARQIEAARILVGFSAQKRGTLGPKAPIAEGFGPRNALAEARAALLQKGGTPIPYTDLCALLAGPKRVEFEEAHSTWADPIVATSSKGRYRIESTCGLMSTCAAAELVEFCHDRLVAWCGRDPFTNRPGLVRLVPSPEELECEGAPFWWAGGFASGDTSTVIVRWTTSDSMSRGLGHELTHRFDGALHPGIPAWALEGRANWVGGTTPYSRAPALDERLLDTGQLAEAARICGGSPVLLENVMTGKDEEYRHNYPVGYSIWAFLTRWTGDEKGPVGPTPYRSKIPAMLTALETNPMASPAKVAAGALCDGQDGRAANFEGFAKQLFKWLEGFYTRPIPTWAEEWRKSGLPTAAIADADRDLTDHSNHPGTRERFDAPFEGDAVAAFAAAFLERVGRPVDALEAHALADATDEVDAARYAKALALETAAGKKDAAFCRRRLLARLSAPRAGAPEEAAGGDTPAIKPLLLAAGWYLDALAKAAGEALAASLPRTARALRAEHDRIALLVGRARLGEQGLPPPVAGQSEGSGAPDCPAPSNPLVSGVVEERWAPQDDGEVAGRWGQTGPDELLLGHKPGAVETGLDRSAHWVGVAVRTRESFSGTYTVRGRVRYETTYVEGRLVVGWTRRDRGVEAVYESGDRAYGERRTDENAGTVSVGTSLTDLRAIDGHTTRSTRDVEFGDGAEGEGFDFAIHVAGAYVRLQINGRDALSLRRVTGEPVEGSLGFVLDRGRAKLSDLRVERHRTLGPDALCRCDRFDAPLDFDVPDAFSWTSLVGRRVPAIGQSSHVRLLLWGTGLSASDPVGMDTVHEALDSCRQPFEALGYPLEVHVAVRGVELKGGLYDLPENFPQPAALKIPDGNLHIHRGFPGLDADAARIPQSYDLGWPSWGGIFVDPTGVVRSRGPIDDLHRGIRLARYVEGK